MAGKQKSGLPLQLRGLTVLNCVQGRSQDVMTDSMAECAETSETARAYFKLAELKCTDV